MIQYKTIIDISLPLSEQTILYPGNPPTKIEHFKSASGQSFSSAISMSSHAGTHLDAPAHASADGLRIEDMDLQHFIGPCRVIDLTSSKGSISVTDLQSHHIQKEERILMKTSSSLRGYETFYEDYVFLSPEGAKYLAGIGVTLVGIDYLSVKQKGSKDNRPHTELLAKNIPILEGINLSKVEDGEYILIVLPIKSLTSDGAPARAVLLK